VQSPSRRYQAKPVKVSGLSGATLGLGIV